MDEWESQLLDLTSLTLTKTDPAAVFWGSDMTSIYNEAFITIAGRKHPSTMGSSPALAFAEVWDTFFESRIQLSRTTKQSFSEKALCLMLERLGFPEETYTDFVFLPLISRSSEVVGFYHTLIEVTQQILSKRRTSLLLHVSNVLLEVEDLEAFWNLLIRSLSDAELDTPFITLYSVSTISDRKLRLTIPSGDNNMYDACHLRGSLGYAPGVLPNLVLKTGREVLPEILTENLQPRGHGKDCNTVVICPLQPTNHDSALGFLTVGLSSCRPYDADY